MAIKNLEENPFVNPPAIKAINDTENEKGIPSPCDQFVKLSLQSRLAKASAGNGDSKK
jgi:hypothetical protein